MDPNELDSRYWISRKVKISEEYNQLRVLKNDKQKKLEEEKKQLEENQKKIAELEKKIKEITDSLALSAKEKLKNHKRIKHKYSSQSLGALDILAIKKVQKSEKSNEATQELDVFTKSKGDYSPIDVEELIKSNSELSCILADMQGQLKGLQEKYERQNKSLEKIQEAYTGYCKERDLSVRLEDKGKSSVCSCEII